MPFDFPNTPAEGATYSPANGPQYIFQNGVWKQVTGGQSPVLTALSRNHIVNPAFQIAQEQTGTTANGGYFADQWQAAFTGGGTASFFRSLSAAGDPNPRHQGRLLVGTADAAIAAGDYLYMMHNIEAACIADFMWGTSAALPVVLRFTGLAVNAASAGTYYVSLRSGDAGVSFVAPFTLTTSWKEFVIPVPACLTGNWPVDNSRGLMLAFAFAAGTSFHSPSPNAWASSSYTAAAGISNGWGTAGNDFRISKVGLYLDPDKTGVAPPWQTPDEAEELRACQRYFNNIGHGGVYLGLVTSVSSLYLGVNFSPPMRIAPAVSGVQAASVYNASGSPITPTGSSPVAAGLSAIRLSFNHSAPVTGIIAQNSGILLNARL